MKNKKINFIISRVPIMLFLSVVALDLIVTHISIIGEHYSYVYYFMNEILNTSIVVNVFILLVVYRYKLCLYNKVATLGLLSMNLFNIIFLLIEFDSMVYAFYSYAFTTFIMIPTAIISLVLMFQKR